jgi:pyruvate/2-oxoglutarate dehydrogenase complex dihydrolipoamide dehydrogenase (E3) component
VTIIEPGRQLMGREDADVAQEMLGILTAEGIEVLLDAQPVRVHGLSGDEITVTVRTAAGEQKVEGSDLLVAVGRIANTADIGLDKAGVALDTRGFVRVNERLETTAPAYGPSANAPAARNSRMFPWTTSGSSGTTWRAVIAEPTIG